jgi:deoxycytidylate deaminase
MRSHGDLDARNGMNRAPRSSLDLTARSFENQLMGNKTHVFIILSLKHNDEVELLKNTFGSNLFLIGLNSSEEKRKEKLREKTKGVDLDLLIKRDRDEELNNGQQMDKIFKKSHLFINVDDVETFEEKMKRFLNLIHGHPFCTPEPDEYFMFNAYTASTRSASLNRQVGAVIVTADNEVISTGCNEVPKFGGGQYWSTDENDAREFKRMENLKSTIDSNKMKKNEMAKNIFDSLAGKVVNEKANEETFRIYLEANEEPVLKKIKKSLDLIENYREEHAEQAAISSCARRGISTVGCKLYCTTQPCHLCIKIIVSSGVKEVFYIEPYPKSKIDLFEDSITFCNEANKVKFTQFEGVGPGRFYDLFSTSYSAGYDLKRTRLEDWKKVPRIPFNNLANIILKFLENDLGAFESKVEKFKRFADDINKNLDAIRKIKQNIIRCCSNN